MKNKIDEPSEYNFWEDPDMADIRSMLQEDSKSVSSAEPELWKAPKAVSGKTAERPAASRQVQRMEPEKKERKPKKVSPVTLGILYFIVAGELAAIGWVGYQWYLWMH